MKEIIVSLIFAVLLAGGIYAMKEYGMKSDATSVSSRAGAPPFQRF